MNIAQYDAGLYTMSVREDSEWDRGIIEECKAVYWWAAVGQIRTAIDVGAHIGGWTRYAKHLHPDARIACVEVEPDNGFLLALNTVSLPDVHVYHARCGYRHGQWELAKAIRNTGGNVVVPLGEDISGDYMIIDMSHVPTVSIEDIMTREGFASVDVLKLDCEGAEVDIISGMSDQTLHSIHHIVGEIHFDLMTFSDLTGDRLKRSGWEVAYHPTSSPTLWHFYAINMLHK